MTIDMEVNRHLAYRCLAVRGTLYLAAGREVVQQVAAALASETSPLLLDVRSAACTLYYAGILSLVADLGEHRAAFGRRIAVLYRHRDKADIADFLELCAGNRGFWMQTFVDEIAARQWLLDAPQKNAS